MRISRPEVFCKKDVFRNFTWFSWKHLCRSLFFSKFSIFLKNRHWNMSFPVIFKRKFSWTPALPEVSYDFCLCLSSHPSVRPSAHPSACNARPWKWFISFFRFFEWSYRSSRPEMFCKKGVFRNFAKCTWKHLCQSLF